MKGDAGSVAFYFCDPKKSVVIFFDIREPRRATLLTSARETTPNAHVAKRGSLCG